MTPAPAPAPWRALLPKEHGLWGWLLVPLVAALTLAHAATTIASTTLAALSVVAGFMAANALGRLYLPHTDPKPLRRAFLAALGLAAALGAGALVLGPHPLALGLVLGLGGAAGLFVRRKTRGRIARDVRLELGAILACSALGLALALCGDAPLGRAAAALTAVAAWLVLGLWWVKRELQRVLQHRAPWPSGPWVVLAAAVTSVVVGIASGHALVGMIPLTYGLRIQLHRPAQSARDVRRLGLTELAWGLVAALATAL